MGTRIFKNKTSLTFLLLALATAVLLLLIYAKEWQIRRSIESFNSSQTDLTVTVESITPFLWTHPLRGFVLHNVAVQKKSGGVLAKAAEAAIGTFTLSHDELALNAQFRGLFATFELEQQLRFFAGIPAAAPLDLDLDFFANHRGATLNFSASMPQVLKGSCAGETLWTMPENLPVAENIKKIMPFSVVQWAKFTLKNEGLVQTLLARVAKLTQQTPEQMRAQAIGEMEKNFLLSRDAAAEIFDGKKTLLVSVDLKKGYNLPLVVLASDPLNAKEAYNRTASAVAE